MTQDRPELFNDLDPSPRLLMGPGPVDVYPRVLRALSTPMLGQFDPEFTEYMNQTMALYRQVYRTANHWTLLVNGTARAGIEACLGALVSPGDKVLVPKFGRFGHLLAEICRRVGGEIVTIETEWGTVFETGPIADAVREQKGLDMDRRRITLPAPIREVGDYLVTAQLYKGVDVELAITVGGDDLVEIQLDTFHDERRAFSFLCNPLGIQMDALWTEGQRNNFDRAWDTVW